MLILLSCAKTMSESTNVKFPMLTEPRFQKEAPDFVNAYPKIHRRTKVQ